MNETRQTFVVSTLAFVTYIVGSNTRERREGGLTTTLPDAQQLVAWGLLIFILLALTDLPATAAVAPAFAWLVLLSVMLVYGVDLFNRLSRAVGGKEAPA